MEDLAIERLKQILSWMQPHELDVVVQACLGRFRSAAEYVERELQREFEDEWPWLVEILDIEAITAVWLEEGRITTVDEPADGEIPAGVFVFRGSW
jgi:hypothetical protein